MLNLRLTGHMKPMLFFFTDVHRLRVPIDEYAADPKKDWLDRNFEKLKTFQMIK